MTFIVGMNVYVSRATKRTHSVTQQRVGPHLVMEHKLWPLGPPPAPQNASLLSGLHPATAGHRSLGWETSYWLLLVHYWFVRCVLYAVVALKHTPHEMGVNIPLTMSLQHRWLFRWLSVPSSLT